MEQLKTANLFDLEHTLAAPLLTECEFPWEALPKIGAFIEELGASLPEDEYYQPVPKIWIHKTATVAPTAGLGEKVIIGPNADIRHGAFIRQNALVGADAVVGNSTELKNVILFDKVQVPHYNFVGDSILGYKAHMGAGAITSNVKSDRSLVSVTIDGHRAITELKKFGAMLGDGAEIGCNSVLNPGSVVGRHSVVYPLSMVRGFVPPHSIYKRQGEIVGKV